MNMVNDVRNMRICSSVLGRDAFTKIRRGFATGALSRASGAVKDRLAVSSSSSLGN